MTETGDVKYPSRSLEYHRQWREKNKEKTREAARRYIKEHRELHRQRSEDWRVKNREKSRQVAREYYYRKGKAKRAENPLNRQLVIYGLTKEQYAGLLGKYDGKCHVCKRPFGKKSPHVDHCHNSTLVRGLLCSNCNTAEGLLRTSDVVMQLYKYMTDNEIFYPNGKTP
jgi:hypothetical protein